MTGPIARIIGIILIVTAIFGLGFSLVSLVQMWQIKQDLTDRILADVALIDTALKTTSDGLIVTQESLTSTQNSLTTLEATLNETADALEATSPLLDELIVLLDEDLPGTVVLAQTSLEAAGESAEIIDATFNALKSIPFVPDDIYDPSVPLAQALDDVSTSLDTLPGSFQTMETSLSASAGNLEVIQVEVELMAQDLTAIGASLDNAHSVIDDYQTQVANLKVRVEGLNKSLPQLINNTYLILTFFLVWFAVTQLGLLAQGLEMTGRTRG